MFEPDGWLINEEPCVDASSSSSGGGGGCTLLAMQINGDFMECGEAVELIIQA